MAHRAERAIPPVAAGITNTAVEAGSVDERHINTHHEILLSRATHREAFSNPKLFALADLHACRPEANALLAQWLTDDRHWLLRKPGVARHHSTAKKWDSQPGNKLQRRF